MSELYIPAGYRSVLSVCETQKAIWSLKRIFEDNLSAALNLRRVSAPLIVGSETGLNDDLGGGERPVEFDIPETGGNAQIVQSLAKWKRLALKRYGFRAGEGLWADMNAARRDDRIDNLHSIYHDQWDWELVIGREARSLEFLEETARKIVGAVCDTQERIRRLYPAFGTSLSKNVRFVTAQELEDAYPALTPKERERKFTESARTAFVAQIGGRLRSGGRHDLRAPDYDDWALNGDILFWSEVLDREVEISSMGIRVDERSLERQLREAGAEGRRGLPFHRALLAGELPLTIGGGIGQSRVSMLLLEKAHIGEVQASVWDKKTISGCEAAGINLL